LPHGAWRVLSVARESIPPLKTTKTSLAKGLALVVLMVCAMLYAIWAYRQIDHAGDERRQSAQVIQLANEFLLALLDAETGQRGYILTGQAAYLAPYSQGRDVVGQHLETLRQLTPVGTSGAHLNTIAPLLTAKLAGMGSLIEMRRKGDMPALLAAINAGEGKRSMDGIRTELSGFLRVQEGQVVINQGVYDASMQRVVIIMMGFAVMAVVLALVTAYSNYQAALQRVKDVGHKETRHLLQTQQDTNLRLQETNENLQLSENKLAVTLRSIGDGVIATDIAARIVMLNPVAERLTGWTQADALGHPVDEVFQILNKQTRNKTQVPVADALAHGTVQGLANHTLLIARDGSEFDIADSCAPIRSLGGEVVGAVLVFRNVTEEHAVQQTLRDSAALVQTILNTVVDGIVTVHAQDDIIESVNPAVEAMFGYTGSELESMAFGQLVPELDTQQHEMSLAHYQASDTDLALGQSREVMGRRKDGSVFPLEISVGEMTLRGQHYYTGILRDISARRAAEEALRKSTALQDAILNSANFSSIATNAKGVIQIFNVGAESMLGYTAAEVVNLMTPAEISDPQELVARAKTLGEEFDAVISPGFETLVLKAARSMGDNYELTYLCKNGSQFPAVVSVTALRDSYNDIIGYLFIGTDNSARKRFEVERSELHRALQDKNVELERARAMADKANLAKSEFLSSMSHELRSPLNAILGFAQLMDSGLPAPTPSQAGSIQQILKAGWYLLTLINEILDLALIESGLPALSMEPVCVGDVMLDCKTMIEPQAQKRGVRMQFPTFGEPFFVAADSTRLKQVILNLLSNAIKYNRVNGSLEVQCRKGLPDHLHIGVFDSGEGLSPNQLTQLFQPFNRLGQEGGPEEGTGIGLMVSKRLVELMGGTIGASSTVGVGSEFWVELKSAQAPLLVVEGVQHLEVLAADAVPGAKRRTLLYVEDNLANMELVAQLIERRPHLDLLRASDGVRGIAQARSALPDVILMDINLPGINGLEVLAILRDDPRTRHIPVMALSANAMSRDIQRGMESGFFRYLTKPIKITEFMAALDEGLAQAEAADDDGETTKNMTAAPAVIA
jgi:PAS domain S-box-containing protein